MALIGTPVWYRLQVVCLSLQGKREWRKINHPSTFRGIAEFNARWYWSDEDEKIACLQQGMTLTVTMWMIFYGRIKILPSWSGIDGAYRTS